MTSTSKSSAETREGLCLRKPRTADGPEVHRLIADSPPLDVNSVYCYLLLTTHFQQTCAVAEDDTGLVGFCSGYIKPGAPDTYFLWQVVVHARARGQRLAPRLVHEILGRPEHSAVRFLETTVSPSNEASRGLFASIARSRGAELTEESLFPPELFPGTNHEEERLLRIGPFTQ